MGVLNHAAENPTDFTFCEVVFFSLFFVRLNPESQIILTYKDAIGTLKSHFIQNATREGPPRQIPLCSQVTHPREHSHRHQLSIFLSLS